MSAFLKVMTYTKFYPPLIIISHLLRCRHWWLPSVSDPKMGSMKMATSKPVKIV